MSQASEIYSGYLNVSKKHILGGNKLVKKWCVLKKCATTSILEYHPSKEHLASKPSFTDLDDITNIEKINQGFKIVFEKKDKLIFKCEGESETGWIHALNRLLPSSPETMNRSSIASNLGDDVIVDEVVLYESFCDAPIFYVKIESNEHSRKCHLLEGMQYKLVTNKHNLALRDLSDHMLWQCPYMYVRRYVRVAGMLTVEAGRRCPTGVGTFNILTDEGDKILECINGRAQTKRVQDSPDSLVNRDYLYPPPKQTQPATKAPREPEPSAEPKSGSFPRPAPRSLSNDASQKPLRASGGSTSSQPMDKSFKQELGQKLSNTVDSSEPEMMVFKGQLTNPHIGEGHARKMSPTTSRKKKEVDKKEEKEKKKEMDKREEREKKKEEKEKKKKEEKERKKEEKKEKKDKKKNHKDKPAPLPPKPAATNESLGEYEEVDRIQESEQAGNFYESMPDEPVPVNRNAMKSGVYSEVDDTKNKPTISPKPPEAASRGPSKAKSPSSNTYSEPQKLKDAWRNQSESFEDHFEDYESIKQAASENKSKGLLRGQPIPNNDEEEDETYDSIENSRPREKTESENIYGIASCKPLKELGHSTDNGYEVTPINLKVVSLPSYGKAKHPQNVIELENTYTPSESSDFDTYDQIK